MDKNLIEALSGQTDNYILPFFWMHEGNTGRLRALVRQVYDGGARALCVESRPHEKFGEDEWWTDMEIILDEAAALGMKVWILDDKHFPTGYANGLIEKKYPQRRKWQIIERHADAAGPMPGASMLLPRLEGEDELVGVVAYPRTGQGEAVDFGPVDLSGAVKGSFVYWDIPEGFWRIFYLIKTRQGTCEKNYIHLIDRESVEVQIEGVYEAHYQKLGKYFGNTLVGFFSDEPSLGNDWNDRGVATHGFYDKRPGMRGLALPWSDELYSNLNGRYAGKAAGFDGRAALPFLAGLWYDIGPETPGIRYNYMDIVTLLYRDNFSRPIGDWCRAHGVEYIGHIIEDMNSHARLGRSAGHYFRSLDGQDMSGIDIVLHQVMPGFGDRTVSMSSAGGWADSEFFHYVLGKLGSSMAHINPSLKNRAMCEVFGAYGWAEGVPMMKWLMDHLLVRGINRFVPHAFSPKFPDPDCPPHFGAEGRDPQFEGFGKLMGYVNRVVHLLEGAVHRAPCALLYHAEAEWISGDDRMLTQKPAKALWDAHLDYDILPLDALENATVEASGLCVNQEHYRCLVVPWSALLPEKALKTLNGLAAAGLPVLYAGGAPAGIRSPEVVPLEKLAAAIRERGIADISVEGEFPLLRSSHWTRNDSHIFMLFNEDIMKPAETSVRVPCSGSYLTLDLLNGRYSAHEGSSIAVNLVPYQSMIVVYGQDLPRPNTTEIDYGSAETLDLRWDIDLYETGTGTLNGTFTPYRKNAELHNITGPEGKPEFSGFMRYRTEFNLQAPAESAALEFNAPGQTVKMKLNGKDCGMRICPPYRFDLSGIVKAGVNTLELEVANTLAQAVKDHFSFYIQLPPSGLQGPVRLLTQTPAVVS
ncbi:MAG: hypothetical protein LBU21_03500 [Treponema sp.]|jgi:hypothetical protein|nr:hypothetical protein [Treponema sp.]